jgi:hypothetical protein
MFQCEGGVPGGIGLRVGFEKFNQLDVKEDFPIFSFMIHLFSS